jgi:hypothetical protein
MRNVMTRGWDQEIVYDDSGTDVLFTRYKLSFEGTIHLQAALVGTSTWTGRLSSSSINPQFVPSSPTVQGESDVARLYQNVSRLLSQARGGLAISMAGNSVLTVWPAAYSGMAQGEIGWDTDNGPKPQSLSLEHISGGNLFRVRWSVDATVTQCSRQNAEILPSIVLNHRWSVDETMDANFFITRTIAGKVRFSKSEINHQAYKEIIIYPLEQGFRRQSVQYQVDPSGLEATYTVVDRQVHTSAPWPATRISGTHAETTGDGVNFYSECNVRLEGPPHADKRLMLERAFHIVDARIHFLTEEINKDWMLESAAVVDHIGEENAIEVRFRIRQQKDSPRVALGNIIEGNLCRPLSLPPLSQGEAEAGVGYYDPTVSWKPETWGYSPQKTDPRTAVSFILYHYLESPCSTRKTITGDNITPSSEDDGWIPFVFEGPPPDTSAGPQGGDVDVSPGDKINPKAKLAIYTYSVMKNRYSLAPSRVMFPLSRAIDDTDDTADSAVAVTFGKGLCQREITIDVERVGELPAIPEPLDQYTDGTLRGHLLDHWIEPHPPTLSPDGRQTIHRVTAHYVYGLNRQPKPDEKISIGVMPFTSLEGKDTQFALSELYDDQLLPGTRIATTGDTA